MLGHTQISTDYSARFLKVELWLCYFKYYESFGV